MIIEIDQDIAFKMLDVLRLTPIYALLGSEFQSELGDDFKPWKFQGYEQEHAQQSAECHRALLDAMERSIRP